MGDSAEAVRAELVRLRSHDGLKRARIMEQAPTLMGLRATTHHLVSRDLADEPANRAGAAHTVIRCACAIIEDPAQRKILQITLPTEKVEIDRPGALPIMPFYGARKVAAATAIGLSERSASYLDTRINEAYMELSMLLVLLLESPCNQTDEDLLRMLLNEAQARDKIDLAVNILALVLEVDPFRRDVIAQVLNTSLDTLGYADGPLSMGEVYRFRARCESVLPVLSRDFLALNGARSAAFIHERFGGEIDASQLERVPTDDQMTIFKDYASVVAREIERGGQNQTAAPYDPHPSRSPSPKRR